MHNEENLSESIIHILKAKTVSGSMATTPTKLTPSQLITGLPSNVTPQADRKKQEQMKAQEDLRVNLADKLKDITSRMKSKQLEIDNEQRARNNPLKLNRLNQEMTQLRSEAGKIRQQVISDSGIKAGQAASLAGKTKSNRNVKNENKLSKPPQPPQPPKQQPKQLPKPIRRPLQQPKPDKRTTFTDVKNAPSLTTTPQMAPQKTIRRRKAKRLPTGDIAYARGTPAKVQRIPQGNIRPDAEPQPMSRTVKEVLRRGKERGGVALRSEVPQRTSRFRRRNPNEQTTRRVQRRQPVTVNPDA